jgi:VWFA-related protein
LAAGYLSAQTTPEQPTFRTGANAVVVDLIVTDKQGRPVHDLKPQDFTVLEDGKPQAILTFRERRADAPPLPAQNIAAHLLPNEYTNLVERAEPGALTVILFDALNTDQQNLAYARSQLVSFLKKLPRGRRVALYTLGSRLRMAQGFTDSTDQLIAAADQLSTQRNPMYSNNRELSADRAEIREMNIKVPQALRAILNSVDDNHAVQLNVRAQTTLDALTQLARAVAIVPGRKNLIWLSGGFPFDIRMNSDRLQKVNALLATNRIAVYPVDIRGVVPMNADGQTRGSEFSTTEAYETAAGLSDENMALVQTMKNAAEMTGGHAFLGNNDIEQAIASGMETGSNYYDLSYRPTNLDWNGRFRKIAITTSRSGLKLLYRSGYYAVRQPHSAKETRDQAATLAMQPEAPPSTQLIMKARVVPPSEPGQPVVVDMLIDGHALVFTANDQQQKVPEVQFMGVAWDEHGKAAATFSDTLDRPLSPSELQTLLRTGLQLHRSMSLKPGRYQLRLGVMDRLADRIGTLDVPLEIKGQ